MVHGRVHRFTDASSYRFSTFLYFYFHPIESSAILYFGEKGTLHYLASECYIHYTSHRLLFLLEKWQLTIESCNKK